MNPSGAEIEGWFSIRFCRCFEVLSSVKDDELRCCELDTLSGDSVADVDPLGVALTAIYGRYVQEEGMPEQNQRQTMPK